MSQPFTPVLPADIDWEQGYPYAKQFDDIYFNRDNGLEESRHVFIEGNDLPSRWLHLSEGETFMIGETGFGTGLNFLLTMQLWEEISPDNTTLYYFACEKHPMRLKDIQKALSLWPELSKYSQQLIERYPPLTPGFHQIIFPNGIYLILMFDEAEVSLSQLIPGCCGKFDSWYLDGFAPSKNRSMWTTSLFELIGVLSHKNTHLATFSCARQVKDGLAKCGFVYEKIKGYGQKREMIKALMTDIDIDTPNLKKQCVWYYGHHHPVKQNSAIILGAGLAGCMLSYQLAQLGWNVTIIDQCSKPGESASANPRAVLFPSFSAYESPLSSLMLQAYSYAERFYKRIDLSQVEHDFNGMILLENTEDFSQIEKLWFEQLSPLVNILSKESLSKKAGIELKKHGLFFPHSGWINSNELCQRLIQHNLIQFIGNKKITSLERSFNRWQVGEHSAEVLILANGWQMKHYQETCFLPLRAIKGQMTAIKATPETQLLQMPVCGNGHVLPAYAGAHYTGTTYHIDIEDSGLRKEDDYANLNRLSKLPLACQWSDEVVDHWAGVRTTTNDYLPIVGPIPEYQKFINNFKHLEKDANRVIENLDPFEPNLYAFTGFGSRGVTTIPLCANYLANFISNKLPILPTSLISALAPARFILRKIIKRKIDL